jgi:chromosome segregation ATPase
MNDKTDTLREQVARRICHAAETCDQCRSDADDILDLFRPVVDALTAEAEIAGQMKHITAEMVRGDQPLEAKEELIADLRARVSHVEAERDQRHNAWAQSVKNEAAWMRERDEWMAEAQRAEAEVAALRETVDRVKAALNERDTGPMTAHAITERAADCLARVHAALGATE